MIVFMVKDLSRESVDGAGMRSGERSLGELARLQTVCLRGVEMFVAMPSPAPLRGA